VSDLLTELRAERDAHRDSGSGYCRLCRGTLVLCPAGRALDCAIAAIEESEAQLSVETEACHYAMLAAMERAWRGEGEK